MLRNRKGAPKVRQSAPKRKKPEQKPLSVLAGPFDGVLAALPVEDSLLTALTVQDIVRLEGASQHCLEFCEERRTTILGSRGFRPAWSWQHASAVESALCLDWFSDALIWEPGPNEKSSRNIMEMRSVDDAHWLALSGGTDWQGFQGGFRQLSKVGLRPRWVSFQVQTCTPALSAPFLTFATSTHTWGLSAPVLQFSYHGDERTQERRCFSVTDGAQQHGATPHSFRPIPEVETNRAYAIAVELDWDGHCMSVFVDGREHLHRVPFKGRGPICFAAVYNWRSAARTAFSQLILGKSRPYPVGVWEHWPAEQQASGGRGDKHGRNAMLSLLISLAARVAGSEGLCPCRRRHCPEEDKAAEQEASQPAVQRHRLPPAQLLLFIAALLGCFIAVVCQSWRQL